MRGTKKASWPGGWGRGYYFCCAGSSWSCGFSVAPSGLSYYSETVAPKWLPLQRRCERINDLALRTCSLVWGGKNWQGDKKLLAGTTFKCVNIIVSSSMWPLGQQTDITTQSICFHTKKTADVSMKNTFTLYFITHMLWFISQFISVCFSKGKTSFHYVSSKCFSPLKICAFSK